MLHGDINTLPSRLASSILAIAVSAKPQFFLPLILK
ncbi:hypothetical protein X474_13295 [Dethiosulfatarculus sandiegensis]|uniref:Uncharacterized protein n=1 Tax=Dethiosulfatarculus sandiegensis TaxID=1429043 RepID=A0A0D2J5R9_9BACT|nr:hypothetical protein X474_13295 [Dethiosulfatarculus sandiegensis]